MHPLIGLGLLLATGTGLASLYFGYPFLTSTFEYFHPPLVGKIELASAMVFDVGVLMVVVGITLVILVRLGEVTFAERRGRVFPSRQGDS
jgi:multicomponent K+:H+ antiporter subunit A